VDTCTRKRVSSPHGNNTEADGVNQLLAELDGVKRDQKNKSTIIFIGATNNLDYIDEAIKRPGRIDKSILVSLPTSEDDRIEILKIHLRKQKQAMPSDDCLRYVAKNSNGCSGAELRAFVNGAIKIKSPLQPCTRENFMEALKTNRRGPLKIAVVSDNRLRQSAIALCARAMMNICFKNAENHLDAIDLECRDKIGGIEAILSEDFDKNSQYFLVHFVLELLAGGIAQEIHLPLNGMNGDSKKDFHDAVKLAKNKNINISECILLIKNFLNNERVQPILNALINNLMETKKLLRSEVERIIGDFELDDALTDQLHQLMLQNPPC